MKNVKLVILAATLLCAANCEAQYGYLGRRNIIAIEPVAKPITDMYAIQYTRVLKKWLALRVDMRISDIDRPLRDRQENPANPYLGLGGGDVAGRVTGSGFTAGAHVVLGGNSGLSLPLGYYTSVGIERFGATWTERYDQPKQVRPRVPDVERTDFEYTAQGFRFCLSYGVLFMPVNRVTVDAGIDLGLYGSRITAIRSSRAPGYLAPYERVFLSTMDPEIDPEDDELVDPEDDVRFQLSNAILYLEPRLRVGYVF